MPDDESEVVDSLAEPAGVHEGESARVVGGDKRGDVARLRDDIGAMRDLVGGVIASFGTDATPSRDHFVCSLLCSSAGALAEPKRPVRPPLRCRRTRTPRPCTTELEYAFRALTLRQTYALMIFHFLPAGCNRSRQVTPRSSAQRRLRRKVCRMRRRGLVRQARWQRLAASGGALTG